MTRRIAGQIVGTQTYLESDPKPEGRALLCHHCGKFHIEPGHFYISPVPKGYRNASYFKGAAQHSDSRMHAIHLSTSDELAGTFEKRANPPVQ